MGVKLNLATDGVMGVTGLTTAQLEIAADSPLATDTVYAVTATGARTYTLPAVTLGGNLAGSVVIIKNLKDDASLENLLTIQTPVGVLLDGGVLPMTSETRLDVMSFYFINDAIGWLAGPAVK